MSREWKPGDVAFGRVNRWTGLLMWTSGEGWIDEDGERDCRPFDLRPLVVIDPDDREQVERLIRSWLAADNDAPTEHGIATMQAALRNLIEPPKPDEPTGRFAVVVDTEGVEWAKDHHDIWRREDGVGIEWRDIAAVHVLSEGIDERRTP